MTSWPSGSVPPYKPAAPCAHAIPPTHELYTYAKTFNMHMKFGQHYSCYLSSNVNITVFNTNNNSVSVPVGSRFHQFKTRKNHSVTVFGILFNFTGSGVNTTVQIVEDMILEPWFIDAIADKPDVFLRAHVCRL
ncbi:hypothetical protein DFH08DRAFT_1031331 [Mycena albidolilacea]|uniref:Uncharacterized protein n=1 Tax=Mycena albidolilacea TaxID=1033008 RepID=A0AAD7AJM1_9AGAR|nr:hypothetical protein DFH08DRAFT_1031331 [Mycena albidolilacea]